jgi:hypothetical protein
MSTNDESFIISFFLFLKLWLAENTEKLLDVHTVRTKISGKKPNKMINFFCVLFKSNLPLYLNWPVSTGKLKLASIINDTNDDDFVCGYFSFSRFVRIFARLRCEQK